MALRIARAPAAREEAVRAFLNAAYSANSARPRSARLALWVRVAEEAGVRQSTCLTPEAILT
eukprot:13358059-Alexandrium_andersonii.AAC.1